MKSTEYISYELDARPFFYSTVARGALGKYENEWIIGDWFARFSLHSPAKIVAPEESLTFYGERFLPMVFSDRLFREYFFNLCKDIVRLGDLTQGFFVNAVSQNQIINPERFFAEYQEVASKSFAFGYTLENSLERNLQNKDVSKDTLNVKYISYSLLEKAELFMTRDEDDLIQHARKYSWMSNNYSGSKNLDISFFRSRKEEMKMTPAEAKEILGKKSFFSLPVTEEEWVDFLTYVRDARKRLSLIVIGLMDKWLSVFCSKNGISHEDAKMFSYEELLYFSAKGFKKYQPIKERFWHITHEGVVDIEAKEFFRIDALLSGSITKTESFSGRVAFRGKVSGSVKIILGEADFAKVSSGDIVVASMTRPDYVFILEKCSAIITNEGGITCHAAIIAREMKKPCIIGTKIATQILRDGDLVEIDAHEGVVKILKRI